MTAMAHEKVWVDKKLFDDAERQYHETLIKTNLIKTKIHTMVDTAKATIETQSEIVSATTEKELPNCNAKKQKQKSPPLVAAANQNTQQTPKKSKKNKKDKKNKLIAEKTGNIQEILSPDIIHDCQEKGEAVSEITFKEAKNNTNEEKKNETIKAEEKSKNEDEVIKCVGQKAGITSTSGQCSLASEVAKARQHIKNSLECMDSVAALAGVPNVELTNKINNLEKDNSDLKKVVEDLRKLVIGLQTRVQSLENKSSLPAAPTKHTQPHCSNDDGEASEISKEPVVAATAPAPKEDSDDGVDLFGSDDEEESAEAARIREERLAAYNAKKSKKPALIAKSNIILDVKPWDDETDMKQLESAVRAVQADGLLWGAGKLVPLAYGIHKLQISCVVEDDKISVDWLIEELEKIEDFVQSVDIAAFNKV